MTTMASTSDSSSSAIQSFIYKTPTHQWKLSATRGTPRSCSHTPVKHNTPADRFIPNRSTGDLEFSRFQLSTPSKSSLSGCVPSSNVDCTQSSSEDSTMREHLLALKGHTSKSRILSFKNMPFSPNRTPGKYEYWSTYAGNASLGTPIKKPRKTPKSADKVLDAPNLINDFYLNVLDWSKQDLLAIGLGDTVYVFNATKGAIHELCNFESESLCVTSLQWNKSGKYLTIGTSDGEIQLWDANLSKCVRRMRSHECRVSSLSWNPKTSLLSSGSQNGQVHNYDPRMAQFHIQSVTNAHKLDVCGLKWSTNGRFLASGGNDNIVNIWDMYSRDPWTTPSHSLKGHSAAVKALSWCPWQPSILASGGGSADKTIRLWSACSGESKGVVMTDSQVSGLVWSSGHRELLSCHGNPSNALRLWKVQTNNGESPFHQLAEIQGHEGRILHVASSPDGQTVATAAADETLRFWKCFEGNKKPQAHFHKLNSSSTPDFNISKYIR